MGKNVAGGCGENGEKGDPKGEKGSKSNSRRLLKTWVADKARVFQIIGTTPSLLTKLKADGVPPSRYRCP